MDTTRVDHTTSSVIAVTGDVDAGDVVLLQDALVEALDDGERDVVLDARGITSFTDDASAALVRARLRAKARRHRIVIVDGEAGALAASLKRTGLLFKFPVYTDEQAALRGVGADRDALEHLMVGRQVPAPTAS